MKKKTGIFPQLLLGVVLMFFVFSSAVTVTLHFRPFYYGAIDRMELPEKTGLSEEEIRGNYDALIDYNGLFSTGELELPTLAMSEGGRIHFAEVKELFVMIQWLMIGTLIAGALGILSLWKKRSFLYLKLGGLLTLAVPAVLGLLVAVSWNWLFVAFHRLFFNNDYWIFDERTDPVIKILPNEFFMHCAILILVLVVLGALLMLLLHWFARRRSVPASE